MRNPIAPTEQLHIDNSNKKFTEHEVAKVVKEAILEALLLDNVEIDMTENGESVERLGIDSCSLLGVTVAIENDLGIIVEEAFSKASNPSQICNTARELLGDKLKA